MNVIKIIKKCQKLRKVLSVLAEGRNNLWFSPTLCHDDDDDDYLDGVW